MPLDVFDTPDALVLEAALPGVKPEDVDISVLGDVLTLTAGSDEESVDVPTATTRSARCAEVACRAR